MQTVRTNLREMRSEPFNDVVEIQKHQYKNHKQQGNKAGRQQYDVTKNCGKLRLKSHEVIGGVGNTRVTKHS